MVNAYYRIQNRKRCMIGCDTIEKLFMELSSFFMDLRLASSNFNKSERKRKRKRRKKEEDNTDEMTDEIPKMQTVMRHSCSCVVREILTSVKRNQFTSLRTQRKVICTSFEIDPEYSQRSDWVRVHAFESICAETFVSLNCLMDSSIPPLSIQMPLIKRTSMES